MPDVTPEQKIRIEALKAAIAVKSPHDSFDDVIRKAERLARWITQGITSPTKDEGKNV